jgi:hypothetical protein
MKTLGVTWSILVVTADPPKGRQRKDLSRNCGSVRNSFPVGTATKPAVTPVGSTFSSFLRPLFRQDWVVYCKPPFGVYYNRYRFYRSAWTATLSGVAWRKAFGLGGAPSKGSPSLRLRRRATALSTLGTK